MGRLVERGTRTLVFRIAVMAVIGLVVTSCGGDDDEAGPTATTEATGDAGDDSSENSGGSSEGSDVAASAGGGNGGTLVFGDETISFDRARCFLEEQDAAAGGGKILFVVQASGTNADGVEVLIDISRFDEDSQFTGDDILVDIGDPFSDDAVSWKANAELGTIQIDGSTVSADGLTFVNSDDLSEREGSFSMNC